MPRKSKSKGGAYERKIARILSEWYYGDYRYLARSRGSGQQVTVSGIGLHPGDIVPAHPRASEWPFAVECKHYKSLDILELAAPPRGLSKTIVGGWFHKIRKEAKAYTLTPLLIFRKNRSRDYIVLSDFFFIQLLGESNLHVGDTIRSVMQVRGLRIMALDVFVASFPSGVARAALKCSRKRRLTSIHK